MKNRKKLCYIAVLLLLTCLVTWALRLFEEQYLPMQVLATLLGVTITAIVTGLLLTGQSDTELKREQAVKTYEEKLRIYKEFLSSLGCLIESRRFSEEEDKLQLQSQIAAIAMHTSSKQTKEISEQVKKLFQAYFGENKEKKSENEKVLLEYLFAIVRCFREELYANADTVDEAVLTNFQEALKCVREDNDHASVSEETLTSWNDALREWEKRGWQWKWNGSNGKYEMLNREDNPGMVALGLQNDHCYLQAVYLYESDFSNPLKWEFGGRRKGGDWRHDLPAPFESMPPEDLKAAFEGDAGLQAYLLDKCPDLVTALEKYHHTMQWKKAVLARLGDRRDWSVYIWYWDMLACQSDDEAQGNPYMDIVEKNGTVLLQLANRREDEEKLKDTCKRIGVDFPANHDPKEYVVVGKVPVTDIPALADRIVELMKKIAG